MFAVVHGDQARSGRIKSEAPPGQVSEACISFGHRCVWKLAIINDEKYRCRGRCPHLPDPDARAGEGTCPYMYICDVSATARSTPLPVRVAAPSILRRGGHLREGGFAKC